MNRQSLLIIWLLCEAYTSFSQDKPDDLYLIKNIHSVNNWNIIYASKQDSLYKVITPKESTSPPNCRRLVKGHYYNLILHSRRTNPAIINGIKVAPVNYLDVHCYNYDEQTTICIEPKKEFMIYTQRRIFMGYVLPNETFLRW
jgi:hypothetical protein